MSEIEENLRRLRSRFRARCVEDLAAITVEYDPEQLRAIVHRLSGAAGMFGFRDLSVAAGVVDDALVEGRAPPPASMKQLIVEIEAVLVERPDA